MVDWMIEVTTGFQCSARTLFIAVKIMDKFFSSQCLAIHANLLHIIGIASMLIASKLEDVKAITLADAKEKMSRNKYSLKEIKNTEQAILKKLGFLVNFVTRCEFIEEVGNEIGMNQEAIGLSMVFARISLYFYTHLARKESQIACNSMVLAVRVLEREDLAKTLVTRYGELDCNSGYEEFKNDIIAFKEKYPGLLCVLICFGFDFEEILVRLQKLTRR